VSEIFKSQTNQKFFVEINLGMIGVGQIFGETDVYYNRKSSYSLTVKSGSAQYFLIPADCFKRQVKLVD